MLKKRQSTQDKFGLAGREAWGVKQGKMPRNWRRRLFRLYTEEAVIRYFISDDASVPQGTIWIDADTRVLQDFEKASASAGLPQAPVAVDDLPAGVEATTAEEPDSVAQADREEESQKLASEARQVRWPAESEPKCRVAIACSYRTYYVAFDTEQDARGFSTDIRDIVADIGEKAHAKEVEELPNTDDPLGINDPSLPHDDNVAVLEVSEERRKQRHFDVVVIGAGVAGLSTAYNLAKMHAGTSVVVLEADARSGGRVRAEPLPTVPDATFDHGASWIHGIHGNPVADIARLAQMTGVISTEGLNKSELSLAAFDSDGTPFTAEEVGKVLSVYHDAMEEIEDKIEGLWQQKEDLDRDLPEDVALANALKDALAKSEDYQELSSREKRLAGYLRSRDEEFNAAAFDKLSFNHLLEDSDPPGPQLVMERMTGLVDYLAQRCDVRLEHAVTAVTMQGSEGSQESSSESPSDANQITYSVSCANGETYYAQRVVVAVPISVLQRDTITFDPPLPQDKLESIRAIGFGILDKVFMHFDRPFWDEDPVPEGARGQEYLTCVSEFSSPEEQTEEMEAIPVHFLNYNKWFGQPVLAGCVYGEAAEKMELLDDEAILGRCTDALKRMYPHASEEDLKVRSHAITRWGQNPLFRGSFSVMRLGACGDDMDLYGKPITQDQTHLPSLFFAGEATVKEYYATVHAAFISGQRQARLVADSLEPE